MPGTPRSAPPGARLSTTALPSPTAVLPPWPGEEVAVQGGTVHVRRTPWRGPGGATGGSADGSPDGAAPRERALYVHGLGGASTNWTDLAALLAVRVDGWALDLPGFGRPRPPARGGYGLARHTRAVVDVLERVVAEPGPGSGRPVHLVGNSLGGLVSLLVAARRPELVATLSLISPAMPVLRAPASMDPRLPLLLVPGVAGVAERRMGGVPPEVTARGLVQMCFGDPSRVPPERLELAVDELRERAGQPWADRALVRTTRGLMSSYLRVGRSAAWAAARRVACPALVLWGDRDRLVDPRLGPRLAAAVPGSRLLLLEGVGHVAMLEAPEPTARAVLALLEDAGRDAARPAGTADRAGSLAG